MIPNALLALLLAASSPFRPVPADDPAVADRAVQQQMKRALMVTKKDRAACNTQAGVANLPFAHGKRFCALDEYLAHLERAAAPIDKPWWKEIEPGVYRQMKTATNAQPETATRAELMKRFGFSR